MVTDDIAALLETSGCGVVTSSIFVDADIETQTTDAQLGVYEIPGAAALMTQQDPLGTQRPAVQIVAKALTGYDGRMLAEKVHRALSFVFNTAVGPDGTFYLSITPDTAPYFMGRDQNQLPMYGFNVRIQKRPNPAPVP